MSINVLKRNGSTEKYDAEKIHRMLALAVEGVAGVSASDIAMNMSLNLSDGIKTEDIQSLLIKSANDLISEDAPNYQQVAAYLLLIQLQKNVWGNCHPPKLYSHIKKNIDEGVYDESLLLNYTEEEINKIETWIKHDRDHKFTSCGLQQFVDKYLLKNRRTGKIYETPQFAYITIAMVLFADYGDEKLQYVKRAYDYFSTFKINLPTPILAGVRTKIKQFSSCILLDCDDSLDSIFTTAGMAGKYTARRAGIGINMGRIRPKLSEIRGGEVLHTGIIPYLKVMESAVKSSSQNGIRGGSATVSIPWWHTEILSVMQLKNNSGTDDNRVRKLDYCVQFSRKFYERLIKGADIFLFSPKECPDLYEAFGRPEFDALYEQKCKDETLKFRHQVSSAEFAKVFSEERLETGRIYSMNMDNVNEQSPWLEKVYMTNLCVEILQPTVPCDTDTDPDGRIGVCTLGALNILEIKNSEEFEIACDLLVRMLNRVIDYQEYPYKAAEAFAKETRSLGIGITNFAAYLAMHKVSYNDKEALTIMNEVAERLQYYCLRSSCDLAKERGPCPRFNETKYSKGLLPIDWYKKSVDEIVPHAPILDWEALREDIVKYGLFNCTLTAQMPCESSSVVQNSTNGIEPVRGLVSNKKAKNGRLKQVVPHCARFKNFYTIAFRDIITNEPIIKISAVMQKWIDMGISTNCYYNYDHYEGGTIPLSIVMQDQMTGFKYGIKNLYYANTPDGGDDDTVSSCSGGACSI